MKKYLAWLSTLIVFGIIPVMPVHAQDSQRGKLLYENHCIGCHDSSMHIREHREKSLAGVQAQVVRWAGELKLEWNKEEIASVVEYLNDNYYKFKDMQKD